MTVIHDLAVEQPSCPFGKCEPAADFTPVARGWDFEYGTTLQEFTYARCPRCRVVVNTTLPAPAEMGRIYPDNYYAFSDSEGGNAVVDAVRTRLEKRKIARYARLIGSGPAEIVDIGCGDGRLLDILARTGPPDWRFSGVEIGEDAAAVSAAKGYDVRAGDLDFLDLSDWNERFNLALMHQVIEHTRFPRATLTKANQILKIGGILSIETPDLESWDRRLFGKRHWGGWHIPRHFYMFDKDSLARLAGELGFEVVSVKSILSPVFWIHTIHNMAADSPRFRRWAPFFKATNPALLSVATAIEIIQTTVFRTSSNMQLLLRKTGRPQT